MSFRGRSGVTVSVSMLACLSSGNGPCLISLAERISTFWRDFPLLPTELALKPMRTRTRPMDNSSHISYQALLVPKEQIASLSKYLVH